MNASALSDFAILQIYLRSTLTEERLNVLAMTDIICNSDTIVDHFAREHPRRLELVNPICDTDDEI